MGNQLKYAKCPHPECSADIPLSPSLPGGTYDCICKACKFTLSWAHYFDSSRKPHLRLEEKKSDAL